jgi:hypothetical protein
LPFLHPLHFGRAAHNSRRIPAPLRFLVRRKRITKWISQLTRLPIARHIITHPVVTRTNTRLRVTWSV